MPRPMSSFLHLSGMLVRAFKVMREVKYCTVQLLLQVVLNVASYACIAASSVPEFNALATSAHRHIGA